MRFSQAYKSNTLANDTEVYHATIAMDSGRTSGLAGRISYHSSQLYLNFVMILGKKCVFCSSGKSAIIIDNGNMCYLESGKTFNGPNLMVRKLNIKLGLA